MKRLKRILAVLAVIIIAGLYLATFICAIFVKKVSSQMFMVCISATILVPFLLYLFFWLYHIFYASKTTEQETWDEKNRRGFAQAAAFNQGRKRTDPQKVTVDHSKDSIDGTASTDGSMNGDEDTNI